MTQDIDERQHRKAINAAMAVFCAHGLDISAPWDGDQSDWERERFDALCEAIEAYLAAMGTAEIEEEKPLAEPAKPAFADDDLPF